MGWNKNRIIKKEHCPWCGHSQYRGHYHVRRGRAIRMPTGLAWRFSGWDRSSATENLPRPIRIAKKRYAVKHRSGHNRSVEYDADTRVRGHGYWTGAPSRTWAECTHPFHDQVKDISPQPIPTPVHNPDLTEQKKLLKRDLQGKDRR